MRILLIIIVMTAVPSLASADGMFLSLGIVNDNIPCSYEAAIDGWSLGPDDAYTWGFYAVAGWDSLTFKVNMNGFTSRRFNYRWDLLSFSVIYDIPIEAVEARAGAGVLLGGNYSGQFWQNMLHSVMAYPSFVAPYEAAVFALRAEAEGYLPLLRPIVGLSLGPFAAVRLVTAAGKNTFRVGGRGRFHSRAIDLEIESGLLASASSAVLSPLDSSGFYVMVSFSVRIAGKLGMEAALGIMPARNLEDDSAFVPIDYLVYPQFLAGMTIGEASPRISDLPLPF